MKTGENPPNSAKHRRPAEHSSFQHFSFQHFSFTQIPLFPRNPLFSASGPANRSFNGLHPKFKFLALIAGKSALQQTGRQLAESFIIRFKR